MNLSTKKNTHREHMPFVIWIFKDGKRGHENQIDGLVNALNKRAKNQVSIVSIKNSFLIALLKLKFLLPWAKIEGPKPDLIIGAGHKTHVWMLIARLFYGGKIIVLMKPSLPTSLFNLVCIPSHDTFANKPNIIRTKGALNTSNFSEDSLLNRGLILLGGFSKHYHWTNESVLKQIKTLVENNPDIRWELTTSRRTPPEMVDLLFQFTPVNLHFTPFENTDKNWVPNRLKIASRVWVTEDSVSMIYEGMTAGAEVGLIRLKDKKSRISKSIQQLIKDSLVLTEPKLDIKHLKPTSHFNEAEFCADEIFERFCKMP